MYRYEGNITESFLHKALDAFRIYKADKEPLLNLLRDDERYYSSWHEHTVEALRRNTNCETPLLFAAIENAVASAAENYPSANVLEREPDGESGADVLNKLLPSVLDLSDYKSVWKSKFRNKCKYGTAAEFISYNEHTGNVEVRELDITDLFVDMHVDDVQDSKFLFITSAIDNDDLKDMFPHRASEFTGDASIVTLNAGKSFIARDSSVITDCYYKKRGALHMMKLFNDSILCATEDMPGYENGLYEHGMFPVVLDILYPNEHCPFGFGMLDIAKPLQYKHDKIDYAITENIMCGAKPRYLTKRNGGIDEEEFRDLSKNIVHYDGDPDAIKPIAHNELNGYYLNMKSLVSDNFKEVVANRDFQQGQSSGGVVAASAIQALQIAGEKRARSEIDDTYTAFRKTCMMIIELIRQFYKTPRTIRAINAVGQKTFVQFSNDMLFKTDAAKAKQPVYFDLEIVPQKENSYSREQFNNTILTMYNSGMLNPQNYPVTSIAINSMKFDGKEDILDKLEEAYNKMQSEAEQQAQAQAQPGGINPLSVPAGDMTQNIQQPTAADMSEYIGIPIAQTGGEG